MFKKLSLLSVVLSTLTLSTANATNVYPLNGNNVVGEEHVYKTHPNGTTTLEYVAAEYHLGLSNMIESNPNVDPIVPTKGVSLIVPTKLILPRTVHEGIVINSAEMRLYYFRGNTVEVYPVGIGQLGKDTPLRWVTKVERKKAGLLSVTCLIKMFLTPSSFHSPPPALLPGPHGQRIPGRSWDQSGFPCRLR